MFFSLYLGISSISCLFNMVNLSHLLKRIERKNDKYSKKEKLFIYLAFIILSFIPFTNFIAVLSLINARERKVLIGADEVQFQDLNKKPKITENVGRSNEYINFQNLTNEKKVAYLKEMREQVIKTFNEREDNKDKTFIKKK